MRILANPADNHDFCPIRLCNELERTFAEFFCENNLRVARSALVQSHEGVTDYYMFYLGLRIGAMLILAVWVLWDAVVDVKMRPGDSRNEWCSRLLYTHTHMYFLIIIMSE